MRSIGAAIAAGIRNAFEAIGRMIWTQCKRTGNWVYERVLEPSWNGLNSGVEFAFHEVARLPGGVICTLAKTPAAAIGLVNGAANLIGGTLNGAGGLVSSALGGGGRSGSVPVPAEPDPAVVDAFASMRARAAMRTVKGSQRDTKKSEGLTDEAREAFGIPAQPERPQTIGDVVWAYAMADAADRNAMDLSGIPPHVLAWLVARPADDLNVLAAIGPHSCDHLARGRGFKGLSVKPCQPRPASGIEIETPAVSEEFIENADRVLVSDVVANKGALGARIRRAQGRDHEVTCVA